jgi:protein involved in polysaccharide export with SLBB domain
MISQEIRSIPEIGLDDIWREDVPTRPTTPPERIPMETAVDPESYILGPNDEVTIGIWDEISKNIPLRVSPEGTIIFSPAGLIDLRDLTIREAEEKVREILRSYYPGIHITLTLTGIRNMKVHISGEVYYPGSYEVTPVDRLYDLIQMSGGFLPGGSIRSITIRELNSEEIERVDLEKFLLDGRIEGNPYLNDGDIVYVPPKSNVVLVRGEVHGKVSPGLLQQRIPSQPEELIRGAKTEIFLEYRDGDMLSEAISRAGGLRESANMEAARIIRHDSASGDSIIPIDLYSLMVLGDLSADLPLQKGDIIDIPMTARWIYVIGNVTNPGPIPYHANLSVREYVGMAGGHTEIGAMGRWKIIDEHGRKRKVDLRSVVYPGETIVVPERFITVLGKFLSPVSAVSTIIISIVALQK